jgi:orotate phosphoribosyltransferase
VSSLGVTEPFPPDQPIVLIDDVVTSGSTLVGAMLCLQAAFPGLTGVRAFAAMRTTSEATEFSALRDPVHGTITGRENGMARRRP